MNPGDFFSELKRRNVHKIAVTYAVVAWLLIQIATQVFPFFEIPNSVVRFVVLLLMVGFPVALIIAWAFELTPQGIKRLEGFRELQRAKELSPANPITNDLVARVIVYRVRLEEAEHQARQAVELDPLSAAARSREFGLSNRPGLRPCDKR